MIQTTMESQYANAQTLTLFNSFNQNELATIISRYFSFAYRYGEYDINSKVENREILHKTVSRHEQGDFLIISYSNKNKVKSIIYTNHSLLDSIIRDAKKYLPNNKIAFDYSLIYSSKFIEKQYFQFSNHFILRPIENLEKPESSLKRYPMVLEFKYLGSDDWVIDIERKKRTIAELIWILNLNFRFYLQDSDNDQEDNYCHFLGFPEGLQATKNFMCRTGFILENFVPVLNQLKVVDYGIEEMFHKNRNVFPANILDYATYLSDTLTPSKNLNVADYTAKVLQKYFNDDEKNEVFLKACFWFDKASSGLNTGKSNMTYSIISLTTSLECLIDKSSEKCECCQNEKYSIKSKVIDLIVQYCTLRDENIAKTISNFYDIRSVYVHGGDLPITDVPNVRSFDPVINRITTNINYYFFIVRFTILNWYLDGGLNNDVELIKRFEWSSTPFSQVQRS